MNDDEVIEALRGQATTLSPVQLAELLDELTEGGLSQGALITYFSRAFPTIPLRVLLEAGSWKRVSGGGLEDDQFDELLQPWLGTTSR